MLGYSKQFIQRIQKIIDQKICRFRPCLSTYKLSDLLDVIVRLSDKSYF